MTKAARGTIGWVGAGSPLLPSVIGLAAAVVVVAAAAAGCRSTVRVPPPATVAAAPAAPASPPRPLYERLGGQPAIGAVVDEFLKRVVSDKRINGRFINTDMSRLRGRLVELICQASGGPCAYGGRDMRAAHAGLQVVGDEFDALVEDLAWTLVALHVPAAEQRETLALLAPLKAQVVDPPAAAAVTHDPELVESAKDRVAVLRASGQAADLLEAAVTARERGQRAYAEQLFSAAERLLPPPGLRPIEPLFRDGGPERVTSAIKRLPKDTPPQPLGGLGASDDDQPEARPQRGSLSGVMQLLGRTPGEALGVVALDPLARSYPRRKPKHRIIEQRDRRFAPHIVAIPAGSTVSFPNFDPIFHNVFSLSPTKSFDLGIYRDGESRDVIFDTEGFIRIGCNLHANMSAYLVVVKAPHYVVTEPSGRFRFKSLAPGKYRLRAWSEASAEPLVQTIEINAGDNSVTLNVPGATAMDLGTDKFGVPRGKAP